MNEPTKIKNRERAKKWYYDNKERALKRLYVTNKIWQSKNKKRCREIAYKYSMRWPWVKAYRRIVSRCSRPGFYKDGGIKAKIKVIELRALWFRDNADKMKRPSIDRIDRKGDYTFENCQFIELSENLKRRIFKNSK